MTEQGRDAAWHYAQHRLLWRRDQCPGNRSAPVSSMPMSSWRGSIWTSVLGREAAQIASVLAWRFWMPSPDDRAGGGQWGRR
ncbi:MAG: hypothetical protein IPI83_04645 [Sphingomonadales bacterium]|nr:hypothetical protein [Sphingomonadales bacterium]